MQTDVENQEEKGPQMNENDESVEHKAAADGVPEAETETPAPKASPEVDFKSKYYYLAADMENQKKRYERERESLLKYGNERILGQLLDVMDNFDRSLDAIKNDTDEKVKNIRVGIEMVKNQLNQVFTQNGLSAVEAVGLPFDPNFHEAIAAEAAEGHKEGEILKEYQKGYLLNGRLLRPSKVVVAQ